MDDEYIISKDKNRQLYNRTTRKRTTAKELAKQIVNDRIDIRVYCKKVDITIETLLLIMMNDLRVINKKKNLQKFEEELYELIDKYMQVRN